MKTLLFGLALVAAAGCMSARPVGPLAKVMKPAKAPAPSPEATATAPEPDAAPARRPTPPAILITEAEVSPTNPSAAAEKLMSEFEYDRKSALPAPRTAEVSRYKGGVKQN